MVFGVAEGQSHFGQPHLTESRCIINCMNEWWSLGPNLGLGGEKPRIFYPEVVWTLTFVCAMCDWESSHDVWVVRVQVWQYNMATVVVKYFKKWPCWSYDIPIKLSYLFFHWGNMYFQCIFGYFEVHVKYCIHMSDPHSECRLQNLIFFHLCRWVIFFSLGCWWWTFLDWNFKEYDESVPPEFMIDPTKI